MRLFAACIFTLFLALLTVQPATAEKRVALVIGNSTYEHTATLPNPHNDAKAMTTVLKRLGFEVLGGTDLPRSKFERVIVKFSKKLRSAEVGLFFYAGHGLQVGGQNYLVPVDAELKDETDLQFSMVKLNDVLVQMERSTKTNLIFIDACRDNPLARSLARAMGRTRSVSIGRGLAPVRSGIGTMITFATEPGNVAQDGKGKHSPFTAALLKYIETPGLDIAPLLRSVRRDVIKKTRRLQVPWNHSSMTDSFYFKPKVDVGVLPAHRPNQKKSNASNDVKRLLAVILGDTEDVWSKIFTQMGRRYKEPQMVMFSGASRSACGVVTRQMGPIYCPNDQKVYVDTSFFKELKSKLGASGDFTQAYMVAREIGHHVQTLLGITQKIEKYKARHGQKSKKYNAVQVRMELQAECFAGVWAKWADRAKRVLEPGDIEEALNAAKAFGDDTVQRRTTGYVVPDSFTHGSSAQRVRWFRRGFENGSISSCDTFAAD